MKEYFKLFWTFFKIGAVTFGGGYAMLPFFQRELCQKNNWVSEDDIINYYAIAQCTPGVIAVNTATFVGYKRKKVLGGIVATLGVIAPSIIIISTIALVLEGLASIEIVKKAFKGIRVAVTVLIVNALIKLGKKSIVDIYTLIIFLISGVICYFLGVSPIYIVTAALIGILIKQVGGKKE